MLDEKSENCNSFICCYCGKECKNKMSKVRHEYFCKKNPEYEQHLKILKETTLKAANSEESRKKAAKTKHDNIQADENERYEEYTFICENPNCHKEFTRLIKVRHFKNNYRIPRFCSNKCANSHKHTDDIKKKISDTLKNRPAELKECPKCGKMFMTRCASGNALCDECYKKPIIISRDGETKEYISRRSLKKTDYHESKCIYCGRSILINTIDDIACPNCASEHGEHVFRVYDPVTNKIILPDIVHKHLHDSMMKRIDEGRHVGWKSRPIESYPEKFWKKVLENNGIQYEFNFPISKSSLGLEHEPACYFLDFLICEKVDLEIDGKQHKYEDRKEKDIIRDELLTKNGFVVYRIEWNEINTENGKQKMKTKIDDFLKWLNDFKDTNSNTKNC